jgi:hypothetical protein
MELFVWLENSGFATWVREGGYLWAYDVFLTSHAVGMAVLVGLSSAVYLRILGFAPGLPLAPMEKFFPVMYAGFWINAVSGVVLFVAYPVKAVTNPGFYIKMGGVVLAVVCIRRIKHQVFGKPANLGTRAVPGHGRILAGASLLIWVGTITAGRLMAYHDIANVERQTSVAALVATVVLLVGGYAAAHLLGRRTRSPRERLTESVG